jgi:hypothetical protein
MTTDDLQLPHSSGETRCYRRRQSASASVSVARIVVSRSPSPAPTRAMQRSAPRPAPSRAPRRPSRHPKMQPASRRRRPLSVATGSPAASLSCSIRARAPAVICSTRGSATLPGRCARAPRLAPTRPSHASARHGASSAPRMQALTTAPGPAPRMQALTTARCFGPPTGARAARLASRAHGELDRGRCAWLHALRRGRAHAQDDAGRGHELARLHSSCRPFRQQLPSTARSVLMTSDDL